MAIGIVIMAGGQSKRMDGHNKLMLPWGDTTIYGQVLKAFLSVNGHKLAVINRNIPQLAIISEQADFSVLVNEHPEEGQSHSVRLALAHWEKEGLLSQLEGILFSVGDQPFLTGKAIETIISAYDNMPKRIICPSYGGRPGNPVLFGKYWFTDLSRISGDVGGRPILKGAGKEYIRYVELDPLIGVDIDTLEQYKILYKMSRQ